MASSTAKLLLVGGAGLAIGLTLGGLGPRAENRLLRARVEALERSGGGGLPAGLAGVLNGQVWRDEAPRPSPRPPQPLVDDPEEPGMEPGADPVRDEVPDDEGGLQITFGDDDEEPATAEEGLDAVREAMTLRERQAWRALEEQADPSPEQMARIEDAVGSMNDELVAIANDFVRSVEAGQEPQRRDLMVFAADTLETMISTEDAIYETLGADKAAEVDAEVLDPTAYVDASVIDVLQSIEGLAQ